MLDLNATTDHVIDVPDGRDEDRDERPRIMLIALGDNMIDALRRLDGERGVALGCVLRDFVLSGEVAPTYWPSTKRSRCCRAIRANAEQPSFWAPSCGSAPSSDFPEGSPILPGLQPGHS